MAAAEPNEIPTTSALAEEAAKRLNSPFLVLDIAQTINHEWFNIEVNDAQDSGYAQNSPMLLRRKILDIEANRPPSQKTESQNTPMPTPPLPLTSWPPPLLTKSLSLKNPSRIKPPLKQSKAP